VRVEAPQLSVTIGSIQVTVAPQSPGSLGRERSVGMLAIIGASRSATVTVNATLVVFPETSVAT